MGLAGFRHGDAHFTLPAEQRRERGFKLRQVPGDGGSEHRAGFNVDNVVRASGAVTQSNAASRAAKREGGAPAAPERHGTHILDRGLEAA